MEKHKKSSHHKPDSKSHGKPAVPNPIGSKEGHKGHAMKKHKAK